MQELTLESLAKRVEALEQKLAQLAAQPPLNPGIRPGTGDWDAAGKAVKELEDYDFDAWREQREFDRRHAEDHLP
jgi:hypothetical protein